MADDATTVEEIEDEDRNEPSTAKDEAPAIQPEPAQPIENVPRKTPAIEPMPRGVAPAVPAAEQPPAVAGPVPGTPPAAPINPAVAPTPPEGALVPGSIAAQNPFNVLLAKEENIHNPFARVLAKVATHVGKGLETFVPDYQQTVAARERAAEEPSIVAQREAQTKDIASQQTLREAQAAKAGEPKEAKPIGEPFLDPNTNRYVQEVQDQNGIHWAPVSDAEAAPAAGPRPGPVAGPANAAQGGGAGPQTPPPAPKPLIKAGTPPEKPGEFKPYSVDGKTVLAQQVGNRLLDQNGTDVTAKAQPAAAPKENRFEELPVGGVNHKLEIGPDGKVVKDWGAVPEKPEKPTEKTGDLYSAEVNGRTVAGTPSQLKKQGAKEEDFVKVGAENAAKIENARVLDQWMNSTDKDDLGVIPLAKKLDAEGKLGPLVSRYQDFINKTGSAIGFDSGDPEFQKLMTGMGLQTTALMQVHVGSKGGAALLDHFEDLAKVKGMSGPAFLAAMDEESKYIKRKAMYPSAGTAAPSGKSVSLKAAMGLPQMKGKSEAEVRKAIEAQGHTVGE